MTSKDKILKLYPKAQYCPISSITGNTYFHGVGDKLVILKGVKNESSAWNQLLLKLKKDGKY